MRSFPEFDFVFDVIILFSAVICTCILNLIGLSLFSTVFYIPLHFDNFECFCLD